MKTLTLSPLLAIVLVLCACAARPPDDTNDDHAANACAACHRSEFEAVKRPPHPGVKPTTCAVCHTQESWHPSVLNHEWALTGAHAKVDCFGCHVGSPPRFNGTGKECVDCHRKDAAKVSFAAHATFGTECAKCHTTSGWKPATGPAHEEPEPQPAPNTKPASSAAASLKEPPKTSPAKPRPKPVKPTPVPTTSATTKPPDVVTKPSKRW